MAKVVITGTSKGIGYHAAILLARAGHQVIAIMRNPGDLRQERKVRGKGG
jgi:NAD(P)-dependent dehydrogenase (short-subunit alcohol dehydrogenase family)